MCGVPEAKIGHSQLCFVVIHNVIIIIIIFLGFSDTTNGYAVWDAKNGKLLDGKHCWFDEQEFGAPPPPHEVGHDGRIYHILKPSVRPAPDHDKPLLSTAKVVTQTVQWVTARVQRLLTLGRPIVPRELAIEFMRTIRAQDRDGNANKSDHDGPHLLHDLDERVERSDEQVDQSRDLPSPEHTMVLPENALDDAGQFEELPDQHWKDAIGREGAAVEIQTTHEAQCQCGTPANCTCRRRPRSRSSPPRMVTDWEDFYLVTNLGTKDRDQFGMRDNGPSSQWQVRASDRYEIIDLSKHKWKFLPYLPKFGGSRKPSRVSPQMPQQLVNRKRPPPSVQQVQNPLEIDPSAKSISPPAPPYPDEFATDELAPNPDARPKRRRTQTQHMNVSRQGKTYDNDYDAVHEFTKEYPDPTKFTRRERKQRFGSLVIALFCAAQAVQEEHTPSNAPVLYDTPRDMASAMKLPQASKWLEAYLAERQQLKTLAVYEVVELPAGTHNKTPHVLKSKVVFKVK